MTLLNALPQQGDSFQIIAAGSIEGEFSTITLPAFRDGRFWYLGDLHTEGTLSVRIPEPTTLTLLALGGIGLVLRRRR